jgi:hypothetical protein
MWPSGEGKRGSYTNNFIGYLLSFAFAFFEISGGTIEPCGVRVLVKIGFYTKQFLVDSKLIP